jgi:hypothetical protein
MLCKIWRRSTVPIFTAPYGKVRSRPRRTTWPSWPYWMSSTPLYPLYPRQISRPPQGKFIIPLLFPTLILASALPIAQLQTLVFPTRLETARPARTTPQLPQRNHIPGPSLEASLVASLCCVPSSPHSSSSADGVESIPTTFFRPRCTRPRLCPTTSTNLRPAALSLMRTPTPPRQKQPRQPHQHRIDQFR